MEEEPSIVIIVLNWNGFDDTVACLESLRRLDYTNVKTVLVDNGSDNDEGRRLAGLFPEVHLLANSHNRGFAGGNNDGIQWAMNRGCDFIVNLNNDCLVEPNWLTELAGAVLRSGADFASSRIMCYPQTELICSDADGLLPDGSGFVQRGMQRWDGRRETFSIVSACGAASMYSAPACAGSVLRRVNFLMNYILRISRMSTWASVCMPKTASGFVRRMRLCIIKASKALSNTLFSTCFTLKKTAA